MDMTVGATLETLQGAADQRAIKITATRTSTSTTAKSTP